MDSQPWIKNTVFNPRLVESVSVRIQRAECIFIEKNLYVSGAMQFKSIFKNQLCALTEVV